MQAWCLCQSVGSTRRSHGPPVCGLSPRGPCGSWGPSSCTSPWACRRLGACPPTTWDPWARGWLCRPGPSRYCPGCGSLLLGVSIRHDGSHHVAFCPPQQQFNWASPTHKWHPLAVFTQYNHMGILELSPAHQKPVQPAWFVVHDLPRSVLQGHDVQQAVVAIASYVSICGQIALVYRLSTDFCQGKDEVLMCMLPCPVTTVALAGQPSSRESACMRTTWPIDCFTLDLKAMITWLLGAWRMNIKASQLPHPKAIQLSQDSLDDEVVAGGQCPAVSDECGAHAGPLLVLVLIVIFMVRQECDVGWVLLDCRQVLICIGVGEAGQRHLIVIVSQNHVDGQFWLCSWWKCSLSTMPGWHCWAAWRPWAGRWQERPSFVLWSPGVAPETPYRCFVLGYIRHDDNIATHLDHIAFPEIEAGLTRYSHFQPHCWVSRMTSMSN